MNLPDPIPSAQLLAALAEIENTSREWLAISAGLRALETESNDAQAGWLMTAFDYYLARRVGTDARNVPAFSSQFSTNDFEYPSPLPQVPADVNALWNNVASYPTGYASQARLHHLLFEGRQGNAGEHGRAAAAAYLAIGVSDWDRIERANCLHWSLDLSRRVKDAGAAQAVHQPLVDLANESLGQLESFEPGVSLHAIEVLAFDNPLHPALPALLAKAREMYPDGRLTNETIRIELHVAKDDPAKILQLHREQVKAYLDEADRCSGMVRMANLEDAAHLSAQLGIPDLHKLAVDEMQAMSIDEMEFTKTGVTLTVPGDLIEAWIKSYLDRDSLSDALHAVAEGDTPTGDVGNTQKTAAATAAAAPFLNLITKKHVGQDGLTRYTARSDADREDESFAQVENLHMAISKDGFAHVIDGIMNKFSPSKEDLIEVLGSGFLVDEHSAGSIASALIAFHGGQYEAAATMAMPRIETLARARLAAVGELQFKPQHGTSRGQFPQLGNMLRSLRPHLDPSWSRFLETFLVSPFGPNYRNELAHGFLREVGGHEAGLVIVAALHLALAPAPKAAESAE